MTINGADERLCPPHRWSSITQNSTRQQGAVRGLFRFVGKRRTVFPYPIGKGREAFDIAFRKANNLFCPNGPLNLNTPLLLPSLTKLIDSRLLGLGKILLTNWREIDILRSAGDFFRRKRCFPNRENQLADD